MYSYFKDFFIAFFVTYGILSLGIDLVKSGNRLDCKDNCACKGGTCNCIDAAKGCKCDTDCSCSQGVGKR